MYFVDFRTGGPNVLMRNLVELLTGGPTVATIIFEVGTT